MGELLYAPPPPCPARALPLPPPPPPRPQVYGSPALDAAWCELTRAGDNPLPAVVAELRSVEVPQRVQVCVRACACARARLAVGGVWRRAGNPWPPPLVFRHARGQPGFLPESQFKTYCVPFCLLQMGAAANKSGRGKKK